MTTGQRGDGAGVHWTLADFRRHVPRIIAERDEAIRALAAANERAEAAEYQVAVAEWSDEKRAHILELTRLSNFEDRWQEAEARAEAAERERDELRESAK